VRENWARFSATLDLTRSQVEALIAPAFPGKAVVQRSIVAGGLANTNIYVRLADGEQLLLRIFQRDPGQAEKEYNLSLLTSNRVPVPPCLYFSPTNPFSGHPYLIRQWVEGDRLETILPAIDPAGASELGRAVGAVLASIHSFTFARAGFLDGKLNVTAEIDLGSRGLVAYVRQCFFEGAAGQRLGGNMTEAVLAFVDRQALLLDEWTGPPCLAHCDFGGSNILACRSLTGWDVAAVLDWEFALSASPFIDLGNLLREPLGCSNQFVEAVFGGYREAGGRLPASWRRMSLLVDLTAWLELLTRPDSGPALIADARFMIAGTLSRWDSTEGRLLGAG